MSRQRKLTAETQRKILEAIRMGNYFETAAAYAGIARSTFYDWLKRGERELQRVAKNPRYRVRKAEKDFVDFKEQVEQAVAESEMRDLSFIMKAASDQWQAAAWRLERRYPKKWGKKESHEVTGKDGGPIEIDSMREKLKNKLKSHLAEEQK